MKPRKTNKGFPHLTLKEKEPNDITWQQATQDTKRLVVIGDNLLVIQWLSGNWGPKFNKYQRAVAASQNLFASLMFSVAKTNGLPRLLPSSDFSSYWVHQYREHNTEADTLANQAAREGSFVHLLDALSHDDLFLAVQFDGS